MPASCQKGSSHPQIQTTDEQESASLSLVRGKGGVGWSEDNLMLNFVGAVFLSVVVLFFEVIGKTFLLKSRLAQRSGHCRATDTACAAPHQRGLHPTLVTACSNVLWASFRCPIMAFSPVQRQVGLLHQRPPSSCAAARCLSSTLRCSIFFCCSAPRAPSRHTLTPRHVQSPYLFKDQPFQESVRHSAPSSRDLIAQKTTTKGTTS